MKKLLLLVTIGVSSALARPLEIETLAASPYADTEAATNAPFVVSHDKGNYLLFQLDLAATPSNNVEVAFGYDADTNGVLSVDEIGLTVGWDCGCWRMREGEAGSRKSEGIGSKEVGAVTTNGIKRLGWSLKENGRVAKALVSTENGEPIEWNFNDGLPSWIYDPRWNLLKLTVRGVDRADESFRARMFQDGLKLIIK